LFRHKANQRAVSRTSTSIACLDDTVNNGSEFFVKKNEMAETLVTIKTLTLDGAMIQKEISITIIGNWENFWQDHKSNWPPTNLNF
jgi:hypothetical protein